MGSEFAFSDVRIWQPATRGDVVVMVARAPHHHEFAATMRAANRAEAHIDFAAIEAGLASREQSATDEIKRLLTDYMDDVTARAEDGSLTVDNAGMTNRQQAGIGTALEDHMTAVLDDGRQAVRAEVVSEARHAVEPVGVRAIDAENYLANKAFWATGVMSRQLEAEVQAVLVAGLRAGLTGPEQADAVRSVFAPWVGDEAMISDPGVVSPYRLETIVRTNTTDAYNQGRLVGMRDPEVFPFVEGVMYSAIMDTRTTEICAGLDGRVFQPGDPDLDVYTPPNHFNCRSILVPIILAEDIPDGSEIDDATKQRASDLMQPGFGGNATRPQDVRDDAPSP